MTRVESRYVDTASLRVHYLHAGEPGNPPVVLLHGFPQTSHMWRHQIAALADRYEVFTPDTRGFGRTAKPRIRLTRDILGRDVVELLDALDLERVRLVGHDWGGIIAFKAAIDHPDRIERLALIDTLTTVWIPWGVHGYWFKCEPDAERFWSEHASAFIRSVFGGVEGRYGGPPDSPRKAPPGSADPGEAMADWDPTRYWTPADVEHYVEAFDDPDVWFHAIEYYRHCLPFHRERPDPDARHGLAWEFWSNPQVARMWHHDGTIFAHPDWADEFPVFAPEDRHKTYPHPALYLYSAFLVPQAFEDGFPDDDHIIGGNPYADSFSRHLTDLRCRAAATGHFIPEEDPARTNEVLGAFLAGEI